MKFYNKGKCILAAVLAALITVSSGVSTIAFAAEAGTETVMVEETQNMENNSPSNDESFNDGDDPGMNEPPQGEENESAVFTVEISSQTYTGMAIEPECIVTCDGVLLVKNIDYIVSYQNNINAGTATAIITGIGNYTGTVEKTFEIQPKAFDVSVSELGNKVYTGSAITQKITVKDGNKTLSEDTDYTVSYENNTAVGTASVTITGMGNYNGTVRKTFQITAASLVDVKISTISDQDYTGSAVKPKLTIKYGNKTLSEGTDYTVSYKNNTNIGKATATIKGKGNFTGSKSVDFNIVLGKVGGLSLSKSTTSAVTLKWNKVAGATGYIVYKKNGDKWTQIAKTTSLTYTNSSLKAGTTYQYAVKAYRTANGKTYNSAQVELKVATNPTAVTGLAFSNSTSDSIALKWNKVSGASGYLVYVKNSGKWQKIADTTALTYTHKNLKANTAYEYAVKAYKKVDGKIYNASYPTLKAYTGPAKVSGLIISKSAETAVSLKWNKASGASGYIVYRKSGNKWIQLTKTTRLNYTDSGLKSGTTYQYAVKAYRTVNGKTYNGTYPTISTSTNPASVKGLTESSSSSDSITLKWNKVSGATGYLVYVKNGSSWKKIADTTALTYTHKGLKSNKTYTYAVKAYRKVDGKVYNGVYPTLKAYTGPAKVSGLTVSKVTTNAATLKWNKVNGAAGYIVYRMNGGSWVKMTTTTGTTYTNTNLKAGTTYRYAVKAYKKVNGKTYAGSYPTIYTSTNPAAVTGLTEVKTTSDSATLKWNKVSGAEGYFVYVKNSAGKFDKIGTTSSLSYTHKNLKTDAIYEYTVKAYRKADGKTYSSSTCPSLTAITCSADGTRKPRVFIGVGHGGIDSGAVDYLVEKDVNLVMALAMRDELERHGVLVCMSRTKDEDDSLYEEVRECNAFVPDLAIDVHNNSGGGRGFECYYPIESKQGKTLALNIESEVKKIGQKSRGCKIRRGTTTLDYYTFISDSKCPAIIVEGVFVDHKTDAALADTAAEQRAFGIAYAKGVLKTLNIPYKAR